MIRRPPRSTPLYSSAASDVYKRQLQTIPSSLAIAPGGLVDDRFGAIPIRDLLLGNLASDANWDNAVIHLVEGTTKADGTTEWTGYSITSEDGNVTRMVVLSLDSAVVAADQISYLEVSKLSKTSLIAPGHTAEDVFKQYATASDWPISHVTESHQAFNSALRTYTEDFYDFASLNGTGFKVATLDANYLPCLLYTSDAADE